MNAVRISTAWLQAEFDRAVLRCQVTYSYACPMDDGTPKAVVASTNGELIAWIDAVAAEVDTRFGDTKAALAHIAHAEQSYADFDPAADPSPLWLDWFSPTRCNEGGELGQGVDAKVGQFVQQRRLAVDPP